MEEHHQPHGVLESCPNTRVPRLSSVFVRVVAVGMLAVSLGSCSKPSARDAGPASVPAAPTLAPGPSAPGPKPGRPGACEQSDVWSYAILQASKGAALSATERAAASEQLDKASASFKTALPELGDQIERRTQDGKLLLDGKPSSSSPGAELDAWYKTTCLTS